MKNRKVAILGLGPSGAFAVRAAVDAGYEPVVFSFQNQLGFPPGAFWLHKMPETVVASEPQPIEMVYCGEEQQYIKSQWRHLAPFVTGSSWSKDHNTVGYSPAENLPRLLPDRLKTILLRKPLDLQDIDFIMRTYGWVFQTFPSRRPKMLRFHSFEAGDGKHAVRNQVVHHGLNYGDLGPIVRTCTLFGRFYTEWGKSFSPKGYKTKVLLDLHPCTEPLSNTRDENRILIGRMAEHNRKRLSHEVYDIVLEALK